MNGAEKTGSGEKGAGKGRKTRAEGNSGAFFR